MLTSHLSAYHVYYQGNDGATHEARYVSVRRAERAVIAHSPFGLERPSYCDPLPWSLEMTKTSENMISGLQTFCKDFGQLSYTASFCLSPAVGMLVRSKKREQ